MGSYCGYHAEKTNYKYQGEYMNSVCCNNLIHFFRVHFDYFIFFPFWTSGMCLSTLQSNSAVMEPHSCDGAVTSTPLEHALPG